MAEMLVEFRSVHFYLPKYFTPAEYSGAVGLIIILVQPIPNIAVVQYAI